MARPRCSPNSNVNRNAIYNGHKGCVHCIFTLQHCKFTVLPDPLIVNLQCAEPQHCKFTLGTSCEIDAKEMAFTIGIQCFYSGHTINLQCGHCKIIVSRPYYPASTVKKSPFSVHCTVKPLYIYNVTPSAHCIFTVNPLQILQCFYNGHCKTGREFYSDGAEKRFIPTVKLQ